MPKNKSKKSHVRKIPVIVENMPMISDLSRALGLIQAVHDTTKGERRATVLEEAIVLLQRYLP